MRTAAMLILAGAVSRAAAAGEAPDAASSTAADEARPGPSAAEVFELLTRAPYDAQRAISLVEEPEPEEDTGDIKWPVARAFALARAGESLRAASEFERLARRLREGVGLEVRSFKFVTRVEGFGVYEEDPRPVFRPGDRLMAYAEVIGFACEPAPETESAVGVPGRATWRVNLEVELAIENRLTGERVAGWGPDRVECTTRSEIHDLHITRLVVLPGDLAPGEYELTAEVWDSLAEGASGLDVRPLRVVGP